MGSVGRVLVLGNDNRSCLTIVRSLGRRKVEVWLGTESPESIVPRSRYVRRTVLMPSTKSHVDDWLSSLHDILTREHFDLVIPCSDDALVPVVRDRARFESMARLAIPDEFGFEHTYLKSKTLALAGELCVPIPRTILVEDLTSLSRIPLGQDFGFPLVVKPVSSKIWKLGERFDLRVHTAQDWASLESTVGRTLDITPVLIQSYFEGVGVGQEFLASKGEILDAFQHKRVHEPLSGGGSSYRKSVPMDERILDCSRRLLGKLRWTGVAMIEYRQNPLSGEFVLMEINGRFWGSLPLAVASGVDFPYHLYELLMNQAISRTSAYRNNVYCRNLRKDFGWFKESLRAAQGISRLALLAGELAEGLKNIVFARERWDTITVDDPLPGLAELWNVPFEFGRKLVRQSLRRGKPVIFALVSSTLAWRHSQRSRVRRLVQRNPRILFVCKGNICRSPFAEAYSARKFETAGLNWIQLSSAGSYPVVGRMSPELAREVSREFGVTLEDHRSRVLDSALIKWAGAVLCMDSRDYASIRATFPEAKGKACFLAAFSSAARQIFIADPWDKGVADFRRCYEEIAVGVEGLIRALKE